MASDLLFDRIDACAECLVYRMSWLRWIRRRLRRRAAFLAGVGSTLGASIQALVVAELVGDLPTAFVVVSVVGTGVVSAVVAYWVVERIAGRRLREMARFAESADAGDYLFRLPAVGEDEIAEAGGALNHLLARVTTMRVSMIDQTRQLEETQAELKLKEEVAAKSQELEQRLRERRILYELLRVSVTATRLDEMLRSIAERVGAGLSLRETAIILREDETRFVLRAAHGFKNADALIGRVLEPGAGVTSAVMRDAKAVVVPDVSEDPNYLAFWGEAPREGSFAAFPILHQGTLLGILTVTRPPAAPLTEGPLRLLDAVADQAALAIRHAQLFEELRSLSTTDELTGLPNRRLLARRLDHEIERSQRTNKDISLLAIDIDMFKHLNDTCGHPTGDAALKGVSESLLHAVRRVDTVARVGGEEFVVLLPETDLVEARNVADKLRRTIEETPLPGGQTQPGGKLTISVGVATLRKDEDGLAALARADEALYSAKRRGRNRVVVFEEGVTLPPKP